MALGSLLGALYGDRMEINSLHHQTVDRLAENYVVTAWDDDGTVEGLEHDIPIVGVQRHPEMLPTRRAIRSSAGWSSSRSPPPAEPQSYPDQNVERPAEADLFQPAS